MTTTIPIIVNEEMKVFLSYGRPNKGRRWYLEAVCRETGRRINNKYICKPTPKQTREFANWAIDDIRFHNFWSAI
ncbi:hypothetical protein AVV67_gp098 [Escherichia phage vB_EcoM_VR25]|uniref:Uncharacterized protein n=2 Tax=Gaprivervirus TaxID=1913654 RepID=A0A0A7HCI3_9CAUD|nr:hypothetical protein VR7_gp100 [Escherichia phage vB_EcoM_VR7]YP_009209840.1 hypothetical protein AVV67_gp098 [Escherichia phage vB_EcoM_VR25]ADR32475.1 hypothetical protein VR7_gp100 [Escherichia phage vB_EcoM_VR7]AIZ02442.1 hypothetical protein VR25_098 [Escherichia phage vB_EcoM_VR25]